MDILHENGEKTENLNPRLTYVPWVLLNNVRNFFYFLFDMEYNMEFIGHHIIPYIVSKSHFRFLPKKGQICTTFYVEIICMTLLNVIQHDRVLLFKDSCNEFGWSSW